MSLTHQPLDQQLFVLIDKLPNLPLVGLIVSNGQLDFLAFGEVKESGILANVNDLFLSRADQFDGRLNALEFNQG